MADCVADHLPILQYFVYNYITLQLKSEIKANNNEITAVKIW